MGETKLDHWLSFLSEGFGHFMKKALPIIGLVVLIEQFMMIAGLVPLIFLTLTDLVFGIVALSFEIRKRI